MRTRSLMMVAALLLVGASARGQEAGTASSDQRDVPKPATASSNVELGAPNEIDFGLRGTTYGTDSDQARLQRYRDLRDGGTVNLFKFNKETDAYKFNFHADHLGYRDQRYLANYNGFGRVKASFEWNQIPLFYSNTTQSLYTSSGIGVLTMPDTIQAGLQTKAITLPQAVTAASTLDTRSRRDNALLDLVYSATPSVDFGVRFKNSARSGSQPFAPTFGFSNALEVPLPVDDRTTEMGASVQWANNRGMIKVGYEGSFYRNNVSTFTWDNPWRISDSLTAGPSQGRMPLWPNSDQNTALASGSLRLPAHSNATAYVSLSNLSQNDSLVPFTVNSALPTIPLDRTTADLTARVMAMNYTFTSRPVNPLWFNVRYRQYQYDNRSPEFNVGQTVNYDTSIATLNGATELIGYTRRTFDAETSVSPWKYLGFRVGYTRDDFDHANPSTGETTRYLESTTEDTGRFSADLTGMGWVTLRGVYEHSNRTGAGLNVQSLIAIGEQPSLRQFDIADRTKDSFRGIVLVSPLSQLSFNASAGIGKEDYPATSVGTTFGLRSNDNNVYTVGVDFVPIDPISMGVSYGYERYSAVQVSRTANPLSATDLSFLDPRRDWTDDSADTVRTWNASLDLLKVIPRTEVRIGYDYSNAKSTYVYGMAPGYEQSLPKIAAPVQLPAVKNELQRATGDVKFFVTKHFALGATYWYDSYSVQDFALGEMSSLASPATSSATMMMLGYYYKPYTANTLWGRVSYLW